MVQNLQPRFIFSTLVCNFKTGDKATPGLPAGKAALPGLIPGKAQCDLTDNKATPCLPNGKVNFNLNLQCLQQPEMANSETASSQSLQSQQPSPIIDSTYHQLPKSTVQSFDTVDNCETHELTCTIGGETHHHQVCQVTMRMDNAMDADPLDEISDADPLDEIFDLWKDGELCNPL